MALTPAAMVQLIDEAIEAKLDPLRGSAIKRTGDASGVSIEHFSLDELRQLRREYSALAAEEASATGSITLSTIETVAPGSAECDG